MYHKLIFVFVLSSEETLSRKVSAVLDYLGYHPDTINWRRKFYEDRVDFFNNCASSGRSSYPLHLYLTGSKRDGTSIWDGGDEDMMWEVDKFEERQDHLFFCKEENVTPGYTYLQIAKPSHTLQQPVIRFLVKQSITHNGFLSSQLMNKAFYDTIKLAESTFKSRNRNENYNGYRLKADNSENPKVVLSFATVTEMSGLTADIVPAFSYTSPDKYRNWASRERKLGWPPRHVVQNILQLPVHVVPKGQKGSVYCSQEFRICYTYAEIELMRSLNETQTKVYVLLKLLFKSMIDEQYPDIVTSYVLKNVVFWISEQTPLKEFTDALLHYQFQLALKFIIQRLQEGHMPNYFIPERNLLQGRIRSENKVQLLINLLSELMSDGLNIVYNIPSINQGLHAISKHGWELVRFQRNIAEIWLLSFQNYQCSERAYEIKAVLAILEVLSEGYVDLL